MEITSSNTQVVTPNQLVKFTNTIIPGNCSIMHRQGNGQVSLRATRGNGCFARFRIHFTVNVQAAATETISASTPITLAFALNGERLDVSTMEATVASNTTLQNISTEFYVTIPRGCCESIGVINYSEIDLNVLNPNLIIERVA